MKAVISVANQKGGVGKTTTAINLAAILANRGERVLLVDLDGQGNATTHLGIEVPDSEAMTSFALLAEYEPKIEQIAIPVADNLALIPGHIALAEVDITLFSQINREKRLMRAFKALEGTVEYIIVDCPPSLGLATVNALAASTDVLICVQTNVFAYQAIQRLLGMVTVVRRELAPNVAVHALATMHRPRVNLNKTILDKVRESFPEQTLRATICQTAALTEAAAAGQSILDYANGSRAHQDYEALTEELTTLIEQRHEQIRMDEGAGDSATNQHRVH
jgi:chromosome partitioning protein